MSVLFVIGAGQDPRRHMTLEAVSVCRAVDILLLLNGNSAAVVDVVGPDGKYEDIMHLYKDGDIDDDNYTRVVDHVVTVTRSHDSVGLVVAGHPLVGVSWWNRLRRRRYFEADIFFVEGITSWTGVLCETNTDPLEAGSVLVDANRLLLFEYELNPELGLYIFNISSTGTRHVHLSEPWRDNAIVELRDHLLRYYPPDQEVFLVHAGQRGNSSGDVIKVLLNKLETLLPQINFSSSLYVSPLDPQSCNNAFLRRLLGLAPSPEGMSGVDSPLGACPRTNV